MPGVVTDAPLPPAAVGSTRSVRFVRYGDPAARPKAYVQAALHADEAPGLLVAHHLLRRLEAADARGEITGQVVVVPYANPIGLAQSVHGERLGRFDLASGTNFNRGWPDLADAAASRVGDALGDDGAANVETVRRALRASVAALPAEREGEALRRALAVEACDSDLVLDLHCDDEAVMHLFLPQDQWPGAADLAAALGCRAIFLIQGGSGGGTFSDCFARPWAELATRFPDRPLPAACLSATVELRGFADADDALAEADAAAIMAVLQRRGYLLPGEGGDHPGLQGEATRFDACHIVRAPAPGIVSYRVGLGERMVAGAPVADVIDPAGGDPGSARRTVRADTDGLVVSRRLKKLVAPGDVLAKIAGRTPLEHRRQNLLED